MKQKNSRIETLKMLISSRQLRSQEEVLNALMKEGHHITQATLSRDFKQLKIAKAAAPDGRYIYVLPNDTMYRRTSSQKTAADMMQTSGMLSLKFTGNMGVIRTKPGYASMIAYNIDNHDCPAILGTIAGDDTIFIAVVEGETPDNVRQQLAQILPELTVTK